MKKINFRSVTLTVSIIIVVGFIISGISSYFSFQSLFAKDVESVSELTSENIYGNISSLMERPIGVSTAMAHDTFLRDFMNTESTSGLLTDNLSTMQQYLSSYQEKYQFDSVFFVSEKTKNYYHYKNGLDRVLTRDNSENEWYYNFLESPLDCSLNVDNDEARENYITIFVNCKLYDENHNVLGVVGVGMITPYIQQFLLENEEQFNVQAYLIDVDGNIQVSSSITEFEKINLFENSDFKEMSSAIDTNTTDSNQRWYHSRERDGYVITRYIPDLNWYLVVEKSTQEFSKKMFEQLALSFIFMMAVVVCVVIITTKIIKRYDYQLKNLAEIDQLTGIRNRTGYELAMVKYDNNDAKQKHFGIGVCDLNGLKVINDSYGHQIGDRSIKYFSAKLCDTFKYCPVFRIGGDEFVIVFQNMTEAEINEHWNRLSDELLKSGTGVVPMRAALGCAFYEPGRLDTIEEIFKAADDNMYLNKKNSKENKQ